MTDTTTLWSMKMHVHVLFYNFGKCGTNINNSFTLPFSDELQKSWSEVYHLTSNLLPHFAKIAAIHSS